MSSIFDPLSVFNVHQLPRNSLVMELQTKSATKFKHCQSGALICWFSLSKLRADFDRSSNFVD